MRSTYRNGYPSGSGTNAPTGVAAVFAFFFGNRRRKRITTAVLLLILLWILLKAIITALSMFLVILGLFYIIRLLLGRR